MKLWLHSHTVEKVNYTRQSHFHELLLFVFHNNCTTTTSAVPKSAVHTKFTNIIIMHPVHLK